MRKNDNFEKYLGWLISTEPVRGNLGILKSWVKWPSLKWLNEPFWRHCHNLSKMEHLRHSKHPLGYFSTALHLVIRKLAFKCKKCNKQLRNCHDSTNKNLFINQNFKWLWYQICIYSLYFLSLFVKNLGKLVSPYVAIEFVQ